MGLEAQRKLLYIVIPHRFDLMDYEAVVLLSPGIDSPAAAHLMAENGVKVHLLYLDSGSFTGEGTEDILLSIAGRLKELHPEMDLYEASFENVQEQISSKADPHFQCVLCKRMMYRAAGKLADNIGADAIVTGESMGQVASQTLSNLETQSSAVDILIHRPLIGLDKNEIIEIAKEIGTYEISIQPSVCCLLTPSKPRVKSQIEEVEKIEEAVEPEHLIDSLEFKKLELD